MKLYTTSLGIGREEASDTVALLNVSEKTLDQVLQKECGLHCLVDAPIGGTYKLSDLEILSPVVRPSKVFCMGANYHGHIDEMRQVLETLQPNRVDEMIASTLKTPVFFGVPSTAIVGPFDDISVSKFDTGPCGL